MDKLEEIKKLAESWSHNDTLCSQFGVGENDCKAFLKGMNHFQCTHRSNSCPKCQILALLEAPDGDAGFD